MKTGILSKARNMELFGFEPDNRGIVLELPTGAIKPNPASRESTLMRAS